MIGSLLPVKLWVTNIIVVGFLFIIIMGIGFRDTNVKLEPRILSCESQEEIMGCALKLWLQIGSATFAGIILAYYIVAKIWRLLFS